MPRVRTTILVSQLLIDRVREFCKSEETISAFVEKALVNQLEKAGDYNIRDEVEAEAGVK